MDPISYPSNSPKPRHSSVTTIIAAFVLLLIIAYVMSVSLNKKSGNTKENVSIQKVDLATTQGNARVSSGFPSDIPLESGGIFESYSATYPDHHLVQSTVNYTSASSLADLFKEYQSYLSGNGYVVSDTTDLKNQKTFVANKGNDTLTIVMTNAGGPTDKSYVYLTYVSHQS